MKKDMFEMVLFLCGGEKEEFKDFEDCKDWFSIVDTYEPFKNFLESANECRYKRQEYAGWVYYEGTIQTQKGEPRKSFFFIENPDGVNLTDI